MRKNVCVGIFDQRHSPKMLEIIRAQSEPPPDWLDQRRKDQSRKSDELVCVIEYLRAKFKTKIFYRFSWYAGCKTCRCSPGLRLFARVTPQNRRAINKLARPINFWGGVGEVQYRFHRSVGIKKLLVRKNQKAPTN